MVETATGDEQAARREIARTMAEAAHDWLSTLDDSQRQIAVGTPPSDDASDTERRRWFYTPTDHGGLTFHQQRPSQQQGAMRLVSTGVSMAGYVTVATIMGLENILDQQEGFLARFDRERGRDPGLYYLRVFGNPAGDRTWGWRFGGHHVSLNNLVIDGELAATTPCFLGANPAGSPLLGGALNRPLGRVEDLARDLVQSMSPQLRRNAVLLPQAPPDLVTTNRSVLVPGNENDDLEYTVTPKGVAAAELTADQRQLLRDLLGTYFDRIPPSVSPANRYAADDVLDTVHFAWAGPLESGQPHYYRLQAPRLLIEWDNTQRNANHAHSVWRDPLADFGMDALRQHRTTHHA